MQLHSFLLVNENYNLILTYAGTGFSGYSGNNGLTTNAQLSISFGLRTDSISNMYFADYFNSVISKINKATNTTTIAGIGRYNGD